MDLLPERLANLLDVDEPRELDPIWVYINRPSDTCNISSVVSPEEMRAVYRNWPASATRFVLAARYYLLIEGSALLIKLCKQSVAPKRLVALRATPARWDRSWFERAMPAAAAMARKYCFDR